MVLNLSSISRPNTSTFASLPLISTLRGKEWESAVADSPVRHALFDKPFSSLRRRTEGLLDQITGGTLHPSVQEEEKRQKEADRQLRCRGCRILFGDERGLNKHLDLFPAHIHAPEYKRKPQRRKSQRSHSTSDVLASQSATRPRARHVRAETMAVASSNAEEINDATTFADLDPSELYTPVPVAPAEEVVVAALTPAQPIETNSNYESFQVIRHNTGLEIDKSRPISRRQDKSMSSFHNSEKNQAAGAASSLQSAARQEQARRLTRGASESAFDNYSIPTNVREVARAIMATGNSGAFEPALTTSAEKEMTIKTQSMYRPLWGEEEEEEGNVPKILTVRNKSSIDWSSLQGPLPGVPEKKEKPKRNESEPIAIGLISFSDEAPPALLTKSASTPSLPVITRRKTNPFLNEAFMNSLTPTTPTSKTYTPSSPFARLSPGNPFARLADPKVNNFDDDFAGANENFHDTRQTPMQVDEGKIQSNNPFYFSIVTQQEAQDEEEEYNRPKTPIPTPSLSSPSTTKTKTKKSHQPILNKSKSVHFDQETSLKASDSPRCPACQRAFIDLTSVLYHIDNTDCNPFNLCEGQLISAQ